VGSEKVIYYGLLQDERERKRDREAERKKDTGIEREREREREREIIFILRRMMTICAQHGQFANTLQLCIWSSTGQLWVSTGRTRLVRDQDLPVQGRNAAGCNP
jgi:hypothetical protein